MAVKDNKQIPLGKSVGHSISYDPDQLFPVERNEARKVSGIRSPLPFTGVDIWNAWEISWLNNKGKPLVAIGEFIFECTSRFLIESKSLKLYLNSFNLTKFNSLNDVKNTIEKDLSKHCGSKVKVNLYQRDNFDKFNIRKPEGINIDGLDITTDIYNTDSNLLKMEDSYINEMINSELLRTNCPVTGQPDWGSLLIKYEGQKIKHESLLKYIISYRNHTGFHENCVEKIFKDINYKCKPEKLMVQARFTRRGGLDINPIRSNFKYNFENKRTARQ